MNRLRETAPDVVAAAVRPGCSLAVGDRSGALEAFLKDDRLQSCRADRRQGLEGFFRLLVRLSDWASKTVRVLWGGRGKAYKEPDANPGLAEWLRIGRRTVARYLSILQDWGYLALVATGRKAEWCQRDEDGNPQTTNEAPVYAFTVPSPTAEDEVPAEPPVDESGTPPLQEGNVFKTLRKLTHARARETEEEGRGFAASIPQGGASAAPAAQVPWRPRPLWPARATTRLKTDRRAAAEELRRRSFALRPLSARDLASLCRDVFLSGWTVADVLQALDVRPDGSLWPHSGAPDTKDAARLRGWFRHRLAAWTVDGEPMRSPNQRKAAEHEEILRRHASEQRRILERQAEHAAQLDTGDSPAKVAALASIRAMFAENRRKKTRQRT